MPYDRGPIETADSGSSCRGSALVISLVLLLLLVVLGSSLLALSGLETNMSHNDLWSEGAFHAAEAGIHIGIDQLCIDTAISIQAIAETPLANDFSYRSGGRLAGGPQPQLYLGKESEPGYDIGVGTGYNTAGYVFTRYRLNATGIGPRNTRREVEAETHFGPVME